MGEFIQKLSDFPGYCGTSWRHLGGDSCTCVLIPGCLGVGVGTGGARKHQNDKMSRKSVRIATKICKLSKPHFFLKLRFSNIWKVVHVEFDAGKLLVQLRTSRSYKNGQ